MNDERRDLSHELRSLDKLPIAERHLPVRPERSRQSWQYVAAVVALVAVIAYEPIAGALSARLQPSFHQVVVLTNSISDDSGSVDVVELTTRRIQHVGSLPMLRGGMNSVGSSTFSILHLVPLEARRTDLVRYDGRTGQELNRLRLLNVHHTRPPGPVVLPSRDGTRIFVARLETAEPPVAAPTRTAPLRETLSAVDPSTGAPVATAELEHCGPPWLHEAAGPTLWVTCFGASELRGFDTRTLRRSRTIGLPPNPAHGQTIIAAAALAARQDTYVAVTRDLRLVTVNVNAGTTSVRSLDPGSPRAVVPGQIAIAPDGSRVWVITGSAIEVAELRGNSIAEIDVSRATVQLTHAPGARALAMSGETIVYATDQRLRTLDGSVDIAVATLGSVIVGLIGVP